VPLLARGLLVGLLFVLLSSPPALQQWIGGDTRAHVVVTIAMAMAAIALVAGWTLIGERRRTGPPAGRPEGGRYLSGYSWVGVLAAALLIATAHSWVREILTIPIDPYRGDMLVVVREGLRRMLGGLNPYTIYHVPWAAPLPYGPVLWGPYALPMAMRIDIRFLTVAGALFIPTACAIAALVAARRRQLAAAAAALAVLAAIAMNGDLARFTTIGHTPVYWPLIALFAWLVSREHWLSSALTIGLLVVARTTMVAIVPVLLMTVWIRDRRRIVSVCAVLALAVALPFLPFAIWDPRALAYALYGSYETVIKTVVWPDPTVPHTIGLTGVLLTNHLNRWVEAVQIAVIVVVYAVCWRMIGRGRAPIALMALALLAFSMTTLWPVYYIYFDVFLMMAAALLADTPWLARASSVTDVMRAWAGTAAAALAVVAATSLLMLRTHTTGRATVTWRDPRTASVVLMRPAASTAFVDIQVAGSGGSSQMDVAVNGTRLRPVALAGDHVILSVPRENWQVGLNTLDLAFTSPVTIGNVTVQP